MKIATCTPVNFKGDTHFFGRDSGLLARALQSIGHDAYSIMPGEPSELEPSDLLRCKNENLIDANWWRTQGLDAVVLYAWVNPRYMKIAKAIKSANLNLIQNIDSSGFYTPYSDFSSWIKCAALMTKAQSNAQSRIKEIGKSIRDFFPACFDHKRLNMMSQSDLILTVSPPARGAVKAYVSAYKRDDLHERIIVAPHAIIPEMRYSGEVKKNQILIVGRWTTPDWGQKDPNLVFHSLVGFFAKNKHWNACIVGHGIEFIKPMANKILKGDFDRVSFIPNLCRNELIQRYQESKILLCCSRYESFHISSAEALCCGASVVTAKHPLLASTAWFTTKQSGTLAETRDRSSIVSALMAETQAWETDLRNPHLISQCWRQELLAPIVAKKIINQLHSQT
jgi:hypothetical protein